MGTETETYYGLSSAVAFRANHKLKERNKADADEAVGTLLTTANVKYENDFFTATLGRQELELEWLEDFHQAFVLESSMENRALTIAYSQKIADADDDEVSVFEEIGEKGAFVVDVKDNYFKGIELNLYYMTLPQLFDGLGLKVAFDNDDYGMTIHYAQSNEKERIDGTILNLEVRARFGNFKLSYGLIQTDKHGGVGSLDELGDHINPLEDGEYEINSVYEKNADTEYSVLAYEQDDWLLSVMFRSTEYDQDEVKKEEQELDFLLEYRIAENIESELLYAKIFANNRANNQDKVMFLLKYEI